MCASCSECISSASRKCWPRFITTLSTYFNCFGDAGSYADSALMVAAVFQMLMLQVPRSILLLMPSSWTGVWTSGFMVRLLNYCWKQRLSTISERSPVQGFEVVLMILHESLRIVSHLGGYRLLCAALLLIVVVECAASVMKLTVFR